MITPELSFCCSVKSKLTGKNIIVSRPVVFVVSIREIPETQSTGPFRVLL